MTPDQLAWLVPAIVGLLVPYVTVNIKNQKLQSIVNIILSALLGAVSVVVVDATTWGAFNFGDYLEAVFIVWLATMRMHYTEFAQLLLGRHEDIDNTHRAKEQGTVVPKGDTNPS